MFNYLIAILGLSVLCAVWIAMQRWIYHSEPQVRSIETSKGCCGRCGTCEKPTTSDK